MSNSNLVVYTRISPNKTKGRNRKITTITPHMIAGNISLASLGNVFAPTSRKASSNYGIDNAGRVGMYVEEKDRAWTSGNAKNDNQAVTIEVANSSTGGQWPVSAAALEGLVKLSVDICKRNGIKKLTYTRTPSGSITRHNMFQNTLCPGPYLQSKLPYLEKEVNRRLAGKAATIIAPDYKRNYYSINVKGDRAGVMKLQNDLIKLGYSVGKSGADGYFGPSTKLAVEAFQKANGLVVDGSAGPITLNQLKNEPVKAKEVNKKPSSSLIRVDGYWGEATTAKLQAVLGTVVDGKISGQYLNSVTDNIQGVSYKGGNGSLVIRALQNKIGVRPDGLIGPITIKALQRRLGTPVDGKLSKPSMMVRAMQIRLNQGHI